MEALTTTLTQNLTEMYITLEPIVGPTRKFETSSTENDYSNITIIRLTKNSAHMFGISLPKCVEELTVHFFLQNLKSDIKNRESRTTAKNRYVHKKEYSSRTQDILYTNTVRLLLSINI